MESYCQTQSIQLRIPQSLGVPTLEVPQGMETALRIFAHAVFVFEAYAVYADSPLTIVMLGQSVE